MLEDQRWMKYAPELITEWRQMMEEGKDVESFRAECERLAALSEKEDCEAAALQLRLQMEQAPVRADYPYTEPSDYQGIRQLVRGNEAVDWRSMLSEEDLRDKLAGAWVGRISGCLLGKPMECLRTDVIHKVLRITGNMPLTRYVDSREFPEGLADELDHSSYAPWRKCWIDRVNGMAPVDDDTNYSVLALRLVERFGADFTPNDVLETWLYAMPMFATCTAERVAYRNAASGLYAPETASYANPYREWIGAQIRGDLFGYICPGNPTKAAELAWRDGSISHVKNGIYGEMFIAAIIAQAAVCQDMVQIIETGLREVPETSRLSEGVRKVLGWYRDGVSEEDAFAKIHELYDEYDQHDWCHVISNAMVVAASLLYGGNDFGKTICLSVQTGFDTDCNAATAGSVIGMLLGDKAIPAHWSEVYNRTLATSISGYQKVTIEQLVEKTAKHVCC